MVATPPGQYQRLTSARIWQKTAYSLVICRAIARGGVYFSHSDYGDRGDSDTGLCHIATGQKTAIIFCLAVFYLVVMLFNLVGLLFTLGTIFNLMKNVHSRLGVAI